MTADAATVYASMRDAVGDSYALDGHADASLWARANGIARLLAKIDEAQDQAIASKITDLLPGVEPEWGLVPGPDDTLDDRRAALAAATLPPDGDTLPLIESKLRGLLGAGFVSFLVSDNVAAPSSPGDGPGTFKSPYATRKLLRLTSRIVPLPGPALRPIVTTPLEANGLPLAAGDVVVITPDNGSNAEKCTVVKSGSALAVAAVRGHEAGDIVTTQPWPYWIGTRRHVAVIVTSGVLADATLMRKLNAMLAENLRGTAEWSIATGTGMRLDLDPMDLTVLG